LFATLEWVILPVCLRHLPNEPLRDAQKVNPRIPRALLIGGEEPVSELPSILDLIHNAAEVGAGTLNLSRNIITPQIVKESRLTGK